MDDTNKVNAEIARLRACSISTRDIAKGTGLSERWVRSFRAGEIPNPGVLTLGTLTAFLDSKGITPVASSQAAA